MRSLAMQKMYADTQKIFCSENSRKSYNFDGFTIAIISL